MPAQDQHGCCRSEALYPRHRQAIRLIRASARSGTVGPASDRRPIKHQSSYSGRVASADFVTVPA